MTASATGSIGSRAGLARDERAVAGLADTLEALNEQRVEALLVADGFRTEGYASPQADFLAAEPGTSPRVRSSSIATTWSSRRSSGRSSRPPRSSSSATTRTCRRSARSAPSCATSRRPGRRSRGRGPRPAPGAGAREASRAIGVGRDRERAGVAPAQQLRVHERVAVSAQEDVCEQAAVPVRALTPDLEPHAPALDEPLVERARLLAKALHRFVRLDALGRVDADVAHGLRPALS